MNLRMMFARGVAGVGYYLAQRRRDAEEFLDMINRIDRIKKGRENED